MSKRSDPKIEALRRGVALWPEHRDHRENLALAMVQDGQPEEALPHFEAVLRMDPNNPDAQFNLGCVLLQMKRFGRSVEVFTAYLKKRPHSSQALTNLGASFIGMGQYSDAESALQRALMRDPKMVDALSNLGTVQSLRGRYEEAEQNLRQGLSFAPGHLGMWVKLGWLLIRKGAWASAEEAFRRAIQLEPGSLRALAGLATVYERKGDLDSASQLLEPYVEMGHTLPIFSQTYAVVCRRLKVPDRALVVVERCLQQGTANGEEEAGVLHAYGDLLNALSRHDEAFSAHERANLVRKQHFDAETHTRFVQAIARTFSAERFRLLPRNISSAEPIFVVGMPRSGTSLLEQILSSHSKVYGAGEQSGILNLVAQLPFHLRDRRPYPDCMDGVSMVDLMSMAEAYESSLPSEESGAAHIVDKMPFNFLHLGLISVLFPKAKIIHSVRDPADTCLSIFFQQLSPYYAFSTTLDGLGHYYQDYRRLMAHWESTLPIPIYNVEYERLVSQPDIEIPALLEACGLEFESGCSRFWENKREVHTASYAQVRRPLYKSAIKRSAPYRAQLAPLLRILESK